MLPGQVTSVAGSLSCGKSGVGGPGEGAPWRSAALDRMSMAQHQGHHALGIASQAVDVLGSGVEGAAGLGWRLRWV